MAHEIFVLGTDGAGGHAEIFLQVGRGLIVEVNLAPGTACNLAFALPLPGNSAHKVQAAASVIHSTYSRKRSGFVIGLQFKGASAELQAALGRYMKG